jgi:CheY-like chemotaxis protein
VEQIAKKILIVEDHKDSRDLLVALLQFSGYRVAEAANGLQALEKARSEKPDLIVMDLQLPGMMGIEAAKILKEDESTAHIPIIAYTALINETLKEEALKAGMKSFLDKPSSMKLIKETIQKYILP